jgi:hypothetical protein
VLRFSEEVAAMATDAELLAALPQVFRFSEALEEINEWQLHRLIASGAVTAMSRGLYRKSAWLGDEDLAEVAAKAPRATICLRSALARHDLIDDIPAEIDIAVPRGSWTPQLSSPIKWRHFDADTYDIGREDLDLGGGGSIGLYSAERSIIDAYRLRHLTGADMANEALRRWLRHGGQPSNLLHVTKSFPRAMTPIRQALEVLL